ncbi:hypothetical protein [uncultured Lamprocystis sp.]|jgi:hypothetical protein|uniref:hypothetical protein n=1 Tax=uncultured Lamprocystis sp. TaxID=543132 RepID=UPI0025FAA1D4|nr:hypothetical protein [uncultured Lamprocystis sp.]
MAIYRPEKLGSNLPRDYPIRLMETSAVHRNPRTAAATPSARTSVIDTPPALEAADDFAPPIEIGAALDVDDPFSESRSSEITELEEVDERLDADDSWALEMIDDEQSPVMSGPELDVDAGSVVDLDDVPVEIGLPLIADGLDR